MPITPVDLHQPGSYPDAVRHITNGDPANQSYLRNASLDLEYRSDVLKDFVNNLESEFHTSISSVESFNTNHSHNGLDGSVQLTFNSIFARSGSPNGYMNLATGGSFSIKKFGDQSADDIFKVTEAGGILFPRSTDVYDHIDALASDLAANPHGFKLVARTFVISNGCKVLTGDSLVQLDLNMPEGGNYSALGLVNKFPGSLVAPLVEGVVAGDHNNSLDNPNNIIIVTDNSTSDFIIPAGNPVYALLKNFGTTIAPVWKLKFYTATGDYTFLADKTLRLIGQQVTSIATAPEVDPRYILLAKYGIKII